MKRIIFLWLFYVTSLYAQDGAFTCATPYKDKQVTKKVQVAYDSVKDLKAQFLQASYLKALDIYEHSRGSMWFVRPGQMRWNYREPEPQEFLIKNNTFWFYQAADEQVTVDSFKNVVISDLPIAFLMGLGSLQKDFALEKLCKNPNGLVLVLRPKELVAAEGGLERFKLLVDQLRFTPKGAEVEHQGGNRTSILLQQPEFNSSVKSAIFKAEFPDGIDIIDRRTVR